MRSRRVISRPDTENGIPRGHSKDDRVADICTCAVLEHVYPLANRSEGMSVT